MTQATCLDTPLHEVRAKATSCLFADLLAEETALRSEAKELALRDLAREAQKKLKAARSLNRERCQRIAALAKIGVRAWSKVLYGQAHLTGEQLGYITTRFPSFETRLKVLLKPEKTN